MEHRERERGGEALVREGQRRRVGLHDLDVRAGHARGERIGQIVIDLDGGEARRHVAEDVGRAAGAGADFQHVVAEIDAFERAGDDPLLDGLGPLVAGAELEV